MLKRVRTDGHLRKEDYNAMEQEGTIETAGSWQDQKVSNEVLSKRKILKVRRRKSSTSKAATSKAATSEATSKGSDNKLNPFSGGFSMGSANSGASTIPTSASNAQGASSAGFTFPSSSSSSITSFSTNTSNSTSSSSIYGTPSTSSTSSAKLTDYQAEVVQLNRSFVKWAEEQMGTNPASLWTSGLQDYFKHIRELRTEHGVASPRKAALAPSKDTSSSLPKKSKSVSFAPSVGTKMGNGAPGTFSFGGASVSTIGGGGSGFDSDSKKAGKVSSSSTSSSSSFPSTSSQSDTSAQGTAPSSSSGSNYVVKRLRRYRKEGTGPNGEKIEAQWVELGVNAAARLVPADGKAKAVIEARDTSREDKKYLINCSPHDGILNGIQKVGKKSVKLQLLELMDVYDGAESKKTPTLNLYIFSFDGPGKRDAFEAELKRICAK